MSNEIRSLQKQVVDQITVNQEMQTENEVFKARVIELEESVAEILKKYNEKEEKRSIKGSNCIKDKKDLETLQGWVSEEVQVREYQKIFTASVDGWNAYDFHSKCDNVGPTLTIVKSTASGNYVFGGFTAVDWVSSGQWQSD